MIKKIVVITLISLGVIFYCLFPTNLRAGSSEASAYLESTQNIDGSWGSDPSTIFFETTEAVKTLRQLGRTGNAYQRGIGFIANEGIGGIEDYSRRINTISPASENIIDDLNQIISSQNSNGGWGFDIRYNSDVYHAALALSALKTVGESNPSIISPAINYIKSKQNADGSFGLNDGDPSVYITSLVALALNSYKSSYSLTTNLNNAKNWLVTQQHSDGGFGEGGISTIFETSYAYMAISSIDPQSPAWQKALTYLASRQNPDGSFNGDNYSTAVAAQALGGTVADKIRVLVRSYYLNILDREPDASGWQSWVDEMQRIMALGINVGEGFQAEARLFFTCQEYLDKNKTNEQFVTDLYQTFLQREPDAAGLAYWVGQLSAGLTRDMLITTFAYSAEFKAYMINTFGPDTTRPENNLLNDLYRGFLNRLPDNGGYNSWLEQMRQAQCTGAQAVRDLCYQISLSFVQSAEYAGRNRDNTEYVEDLYNAILRRGADPAGFQAWVNNLNSGMTRQQALKFFTDSTEFQGRVDAVIAAGCLP